ncbi:iron-sulfur cluster assembly scaffold protein IscU [Tepiditoga spiralis]|uniref:Iron-sulfur cluster assembly scaffold protein IscU n=1 Tax=Tepiditoga spiralis TaxID=2108365 RepID=A0A7G1G604_9BACT|nr:SUF system NifU family Fe-S cluster assembly protein [Tepiditoga spiralis]BBE30514.1 iron-sulfur cluster assembly scaffold protein IscU [Tepiditoga spiralis]
MSIEDLYTDIILDYAKNKKFKKEIKNAWHEHGKNLSCGDELELYVKLEDGVIKDASYTGHGCIVSQASASIMCESIKGKKLSEAKKIVQNVLNMAQGNEYNEEVVGDIEIFEDISNYPMRVKCFTLSWHTFDTVLKNAEVKKDD